MPEFDAKELAVWSGGTWVANAPERVVGVSNDTRTIGRGALYFALAGDRFDGHDFVADAMTKGAAGAVVRADRVHAIRRRCGPVAESWPLLAVTDTRKALMGIAGGHAARIAPEMVGVTGSVGKSTVKEMTAGILGVSRRTARTKGNWNNDVGLPLSMLEMEESTEIGVFELGSNHPGEIAQLCKVLRPRAGVVTNVGPVHLEHFGSVLEIAREKGALPASIPGDGFVVLDSGGDFFEVLSSMCGGRVVTVGRRSGIDDYVCLADNPVTGEFTVLERDSGEQATLRVAVPGAHNIANAMPAVAVGRVHGVAWADVRAALAAYSPLPMRWQRSRVRWWKGAGDANGNAPVVGIVNDAYNANPVSMRAAINTFAGQPTVGRKWLVLSDMLELGPGAEAEHEALGAFVAGVVSRDVEGWGGLVVVGELGRAIVRGAAAAGIDADRAVWCNDGNCAYEALSDRISSGDDLLLKGSRGMHVEELIEGMEEQR